MEEAPIVQIDEMTEEIAQMEALLTEIAPDSEAAALQTELEEIEEQVALVNEEEARDMVPEADVQRMMGGLNEQFLSIKDRILQLLS